MINNSNYLTKACHCDKPKLKEILIKSIMYGKSYGKERVLMYCENCKSQWWRIRNPKPRTKIMDDKISEYKTNLNKDPLEKMLLEKYKKLYKSRMMNDKNLEFYVTNGIYNEFDIKYIKGELPND